LLLSISDGRGIKALSGPLHVAQVRPVVGKVAPAGLDMLDQVRGLGLDRKGVLNLTPQPMLKFDLPGGHLPFIRRAEPKLKFGAGPLDIDLGLPGKTIEDRRHDDLFLLPRLRQGPIVKISAVIGRDAGAGLYPALGIVAEIDHEIIKPEQIGDTDRPNTYLPALQAIGGKEVEALENNVLTEVALDVFQIEIAPRGPRLRGAHDPVEFAVVGPPVPPPAVYQGLEGGVNADFVIVHEDLSVGYSP